MKQGNKALTNLLRYSEHSKQDSMLNTPPTFSWYVAGKVFKWVKKLGGKVTQTRMSGAHQAIKAITTDANLTSGVHFGFAYWSSSATVWVYWNYNKL